METAKEILMRKIFEDKKIKRIELQKSTISENGKVVIKYFIVTYGKLFKDDYDGLFSDIESPEYTEITRDEYMTLFFEILDKPNFYLSEERK